MLILPLHKPLNLSTLPLVTMLLVLANVYVFFGWQAGDEQKVQATQVWYQHSGLAGYELPAYEKHLRLTAQRDALAELEAVPAQERGSYVGMATLSDVSFHKALQQGGLFESEQQQAAWVPLRRDYQAQLDQVFTLRHILRSSEWSPWRLLSAAFLHGSVMHLLGNMVFLVVLGLLLEGALGGWRFLGLYLLGAVGSSAASVLWRWGEAGGGLGASGAIAAVMGAFCVVWGMRPVRFFYWFGVIFDYVRAPAICLLPLWLGWEVFNLLSNDEAGIGFDAHAGGLICGAVLGGLLVLTRQTRDDYMVDETEIAAGDQRWEQARQYMGRLDNAAAERVLAELAVEQPQRLDVALARYRVAANAGRTANMRARAADVLRLEAGDAAGLAAQQAIIKQLLAEGGIAELAPAAFERCLKAGWLQEAEAVWEQAIQLPGEMQAQGWLRLALRHGEAHAHAQRRRLLELLQQRFAATPQAGKARFLLEND
ncbi:MULTISPECIES: rhomboid family intramembrane serine protease [Stenotrophomonas]|uniref:rhomboid family intramembrane serine protease n=1 Tax=Stenotrophomonas TaxID=40323 RepID=UPI0007705B5B|nr:MULTISPECIES: rhomboid family intramembrane serine protease [Stenotrophomonas]AMJ57079.1 rhomboid family intramembrane serine protease [Stenotrophomonas sp. KCTC 12332]